MSLWKRFCRNLPLLVSPLLLAGSSADYHGPEPPAGQQNPQATTTVRVSVGLVQTDVMVFDRQGRFVPDLKLEQFDLRVDGKRQPIAFCELVSSGSGRNETLWTSNPPAAAAPAPAAAGGSDVGRTILFFLDDWHLSADSLMRSRAALLNLIDTAVGVAVDNGGTFLNNTNALNTAMTRTLAETSRYYLLGWYLDRDMREPGKYRSIRAGIKGRSDLKVRVRQGKVDLTLLAAQGQDGKVMATPAKTDPAEAMMQTIRSPFPIGALPVSLFTGYDLLRDKGFGLRIALQTAIEQVESEASKAADDPRIDFAGLVSDTAGETVASFSDSLSMPTDPALQREGGDKDWNYSGVILLAAGIYQVRVAVRDSRAGRTGSSLQWVDIPQFSPDKITLSSIFLQENGTGRTLEADAVPDLMNGSVISIKRRFSISSKVSYFLPVLNPRLTAIVVQTRIYRGNRVVCQSVPGPPDVQGSEDVSRMLIRGTLPLEDLAPGNYTLEILVREPSSNPAAVQRIHFWVR
jgi:hypothetical protein